MNVFSETIGIDVTLLSAFISWVTSTSVIVFVTVAIKGMYWEAVEGKKAWIDIIIRVSVAMALVTGVGVILR